MFLNSTNKQINETRKSIDLISERKSEYIQQVDIPIQLLKEEEGLKARLKELLAQKAETDSSETPPASTTVSKSRLALLLLIPALIGVGLYIYQPPAPVQSETSVSGTPQPPTPVQPEVLVPDTAPLSPTSISIEGHTTCKEEMGSLYRLLKEKLNKTTIKVNQSKPWHETNEIPQLLIHFNDCNTPKNINIDYKIHVEKGPPEVYQPKLIHLEVPNNSIQIERVAIALGFYLYRDYESAITILKIASRNSSTEHNSFIFRLLQGNSLLFSYKYSEAVRVYAKVAKKNDVEVLFNNLGIAQTYADWNLKDEDEKDWFAPAKISFNKALKLNPAYKIPYINLAKIHEKLASQKYKKSFATDALRHYQITMDYCNKLDATPTPKIEINSNVMKLATFCPYKFRLGMYMSDPERHSLLDSYLTNIHHLATPYWSEPLIMDAFHRSFKKKNDPTITGTLEAKERAYSACRDDILFTGLKKGCEILKILADRERLATSKL
ncbi:MAG: hypothetical protein V3U78_08205 [Thiotrichaceae bacterium]